MLYVSRNAVDQGPHKSKPGWMDGWIDWIILCREWQKNPDRRMAVLNPVLAVLYGEIALCPTQR